MVIKDVVGSKASKLELILKAMAGCDIDFDEAFDRLVFYERMQKHLDTVKKVNKYSIVRYDNGMGGDIYDLNHNKVSHFYFSGDQFTSDDKFFRKSIFTKSFNELTIRDCSEAIVEYDSYEGFSRSFMDWKVVDDFVELHNGRMYLHVIMDKSNPSKINNLSLFEIKYTEEILDTKISDLAKLTTEEIMEKFKVTT